MSRPLCKGSDVGDIFAILSRADVSRLRRGAKTSEVANGAQDRDTETHRPIGVERYRQAEPGFGECERGRNEKPAPQPAGDSPRCSRWTNHQREYQQNADDLSAFRHRQRHDGKKGGGDETQRHTFGLGQFWLQAGEDQRPHYHDKGKKGDSAKDG